jgi:hypothetical protein
MRVFQPRGIPERGSRKTAPHCHTSRHFEIWWSLAVAACILTTCPPRRYFANPDEAPVFLSRW